MTMLERVARAMARDFNKYHFDRGDSDVGWTENISAARAAVAAMREPTPGMLDALSDQLSRWVKEEGSDADVFTAAIDAILAEDTP